MPTKEEMRAKVVETANISDPEALAKIEGEAQKIAGAQTTEAEIETSEDEDLKAAARNDVESVDTETEDEDESETENETETKPEPKEEKKLTQEAVNRRIAKEQRKRATAEAEAAVLRQRIADLEKKDDGEKPLTQKEVDELADKKAEAIAAEKVFSASWGGLLSAAEKEWGTSAKFNEACNEFVEDIGQLDRGTMDVLLQMPNGHSILNYLIKNPDEADKIVGMNAARQMREITSMSLKLEAATKKPISKVPPPIKPIGGKSKSDAGQTPSDSDNDADWFAKRQATKRERVWK